MALISQKLAFLKFLRSQLEGINPENIDPATGAPYTIDLRDKVFIGRKIIGNDVPLPCIALNEAPVPEQTAFADDGGTKQAGGWRKLLQGFAARDGENPAEPAYELMAMVEKRLSRIVERTNGKPTFPDEAIPAKFKVSSLRVHRGVVSGPDDKVSATGFFYIPLTTTMATDLSNPYVEEN